MTIYISEKKLSKKLAIPFLMLWVTMGVFLWVVPFPDWLVAGTVEFYVIKGILAFGIFMGFLMTLCWSIWGENNGLGGKG